MANKIDTRFVVPPQPQRAESSRSQGTVVPPAQQQATTVAHTLETVLPRMLGKDGFHQLKKDALPVLRESGMDAPHNAIPQSGLGFETREPGAPAPGGTLELIHPKDIQPTPDPVEVKGSASPGLAIHGKQ